MADEYGLHSAATACGSIPALVAAYLQLSSRFHRDKEMVERVRLAADLLARETTPDGNLDNPITNFNSPPDTAFGVRAMCTGAILAQRQGERELFGMMAPFLRKAGASLVRRGVHTPNHRWVVCAALAQLTEIFGDQGYLRRIDQWLAETIDIDADGMYDERSTVQYNPIVDAALCVMAAKLKRPELLGYVRRNLDGIETAGISCRKVCRRRTTSRSRRPGALRLRSGLRRRSCGRKVRFAGWNNRPRSRRGRTASGCVCSRMGQRMFRWRLRSIFARAGSRTGCTNTRSPPRGAGLCRSCPGRVFI